MNTHCPFQVSAHALQLFCHEYAIGIRPIISKRPAIRKAKALIQLLSWHEGLYRACFETQTLVAARACHGQYMREYRAPYPLSSHRVCCSHRLDFTVRGIDLLQCAAAEKCIALSCRPECDIAAFEATDVKRMNTLRRRELVHIAEVLFKKCFDIRSGGVIDLDTHVVFVVVSHDGCGLARTKGVPDQVASVDASRGNPLNLPMTATIAYMENAIESTRNAHVVKSPTVSAM